MKIKEVIKYSHVPKPKLQVKCYVSLTWRCSIPFEELRITNAFAQHLYIFFLSILSMCVVVSNEGVGRNSRILTKCIQIKQNAKECKAITMCYVDSLLHFLKYSIHENYLDFEM